MNHKEVQDIATKHGLGQVHFQYNTAQNTGKSFEVGYVSVGKSRELFCKRGSDSNPDQFYLCNEYRKLTDVPVSAPKVQIRNVVVGGITYLRQEDVANYIREIASTEETDVRNRLNEAANNIQRG